MGPKARGEAGEIIRSQSMQGLASTIEYEPCSVSNGIFWTPLERPYIIVLISITKHFLYTRGCTNYMLFIPHNS